MAHTRNSMTNGDDVQITLRPDTYTKLNSLVKRIGTSGQLSGHPAVSTGIKVHCHVPVCIGYGPGTMSPENLSALVLDLQTKGYDFTIYAAPRKQFDNEDEDPYVVWQRENADLLRQVGHKVILEAEWRKSDCWIKANAKYLSYKERNSVTVEALLTQDVRKYLERQKTKLPSDNANTLGQEEIKAHMLGCVVDILSWMESVDQPPPIEKLNVLVYTHDLTQLMKNAINSAGKIGYILGSLLHIEPKFEEKLGLDTVQQNSAVSPLQYAKTLSGEPGLSLAEQQALSAIVLAGLNGGVDTLELAKFATAMVNECESKRRDEYGEEVVPVIQASSAASSSSSLSTGYRGYTRQSSPNSSSVARNGMFAPAARIAAPMQASSAAAVVSSSSSSMMSGSQGATQPASSLRPH